MSMTRPFLIGKSAGGGDASASNDAGEAGARSARPQMPSPVEQAIVAVDFRNSRRDGVFLRTSEGVAKLVYSPRILSQLEIRSANSTQLIQVNLRVPLLGGLQRLFPCDFPSRIRRRARHHARKSGFSSLVRLIVKLSADNTAHKRLLLLPVRKFQV